MAKVNLEALAREFAEDFPVKVSNKDAKLAIERMFELITENLQQGHEVTVPGFGKFAVKQTVERTGRNPSTGEQIIIPAKKGFKFTPAKALKERLA